MADVQLEHGHLRIANALDEAITFAAFTGTQTKVVRCLVRLTFGWRRHTVRIALPDIAERCNVAFTGGFRRALDELIREGVVLEIEQSSGRCAALYAINKDFEAWGKFSVAARALESLYGERPESNDSRIPRSHSLLDKEPPQGHEQESYMPPQGESHAPTGQDDSPHRGMNTGAKSLIGETVQPPKDSERHERQVDVDDEAPVPEPELSALYIAIWANRAALERWPNTTRTYTPGSATSIATDLREAGVEWQVVRESIYRQMRKLPEQPGSVHYFRPGILKAWDAEKARRAMRASGEQPPTVMPDAPKVEREHWLDAKKRQEREENDKQLARARGGNVEQRRKLPDGEQWWARMLADAKAAGVHPVLYAYDRIKEPAEVNRASA